MSSDRPEPQKPPSWRVDTDAEIGAIALGPPFEDHRSNVPAVLHFEWYSSSGETLVLGDIAQVPTGLIISRMEIVMQQASGVTRDLLRNLPIGDVLACARDYLRKQDQLTHSVVTEAAEVPVTTGRTKMTEDLLRQVALAYIEETAPGKDRGAMHRMVERFGRPEGTIQTWIKRARKEEWLAPGPSGRMGAEPGPRLMIWQLEKLKRENPGMISHVQVDKDGNVTPK